MPLTVPTPAEFAALDWHKRDKALRTMRRLIRAYGEFVDETPTRTALSARARAERDAEWGERVRAEARALAGETP